MKKHNAIMLQSEKSFLTHSRIHIHILTIRTQEIEFRKLLLQLRISLFPFSPPHPYQSFPIEFRFVTSIIKTFNRENVALLFFPPSKHRWCKFLLRRHFGKYLLVKLRDRFIFQQILFQKYSIITSARSRPPSLGNPAKAKPILDCFLWRSELLGKLRYGVIIKCQKWWGVFFLAHVQPSKWHSGLISLRGKKRGFQSLLR